MPSTGRLNAPCTVKPFLYFSLSFFHSSRVCSGWVKFNVELERNKLILWELIGREAIVVDGPWWLARNRGAPRQNQIWARSVFLERDVVHLYSERAIGWQPEPFFSGSCCLVFQSRLWVLLGLSGHKSLPSSAEKLLSMLSHFWFSHGRKILHSLSIKDIVMHTESREQFCLCELWGLEIRKKVFMVLSTGGQGVFQSSKWDCHASSVKESTW